MLRIPFIKEVRPVFILPPKVLLTQVASSAVCPFLIGVSESGDSLSGIWALRQSGIWALRQAWQLGSGRKCLLCIPMYGWSGYWGQGSFTYIPLPAPKIFHC